MTLPPTSWSHRKVNEEARRIQVYYPREDPNWRYGLQFCPPIEMLPPILLNFKKFHVKTWSLILLSQFLQAIPMSLMRIPKTRGPNWDSCGTPDIRTFSDNSISPYLTYLSCAGLWWNTETLELEFSEKLLRKSPLRCIIWASATLFSWWCFVIFKPTL